MGGAIGGSTAPPPSLIPATELQGVDSGVLRRPQRVGLVHLVRRLVCLETGLVMAVPFDRYGAWHIGD
jgi:hypothetical protein